LNSISAGYSQGLSSTSRARSQEQAIQRAQSRISASQANRSRNTLPNILENMPQGSEHTLALTAGKRMPKPGDRNAPTFDPEKPEELGRFFDRVEEWFEDDDITEDEEKKKRIVRYLDPDSEIQWKAFSKFEQGTYADFKAQVMQSYPKAEEVMKGSMTALKRKLKKLGTIAVDERDELLALIRTMTAEVAKLKKITPPIHTNRELVELFLGRLTPDFAARIANKLSVHRLMLDDKEIKRNPEDMFDICEVMEMAKHTSLENANPFGKFLWTTAGTSSDSKVKLEEVVAKLTDSINLQAQYTKQVDQKLTSLQNSIVQPKQNFAAAPGYARNLMPVTTNHQNNILLECFYCKMNVPGPHRIQDCEHARTHLDLGWIKKIDGQIRLADGSRVPRNGDKSMKEVVEELNKTRPGIIPVTKIRDKASLFQSNDSSSSSSSNQTKDDADVWLLKELMQRVPHDKLQQLLNQAQTLDSEEDEWEQNFY
jgi:hypothetical protein